MATSASPTDSTCTYPDDGSFTVKLTSADEVGATGADTANVTVANVAPIVTNAPDQSTFAGSAKNFRLGSFSDPGADALWQVTVEWGDDSANSTFDVSTAGIFSATHTYPLPGTYNVLVTVNDGAATAMGDFQATANPGEVGIVTGVIFDDKNSNGTQETGEEGISDAIVKLSDEVVVANHDGRDHNYL